MGQQYCLPLLQLSAGNAATISAGSVQNGSASGTAGGFSDTLGAMVTDAVSSAI